MGGVGPQLPFMAGSLRNVHGVPLAEDFGYEVQRMPPLLKSILLFQQTDEKQQAGCCGSSSEASTAAATTPEANFGVISEDGVSYEAHLAELARVEGFSDELLLLAGAQRAATEPPTAGEDSGREATPPPLFLSRKAVLSSGQCATLRAEVEARKQTKRDSVDGAADHQLNLSKEELEGLIGRDAVASLWQVARDFRNGEAIKLPFPEKAEIFVRRYCPETRPWIPFHKDSAQCTLNLALVGDVASNSSPGEFMGGRLLLLNEAAGKLEILDREEGEALVHKSNLLHGVSMITRGVRYSLIVFFDLSAAQAQEMAEVESHLKQHQVLDDYPLDDAGAVLLLPWSEEFQKREAERLASMLEEHDDVWQRTLGSAKYSTLRENWEVAWAGKSPEARGRGIEEIVKHYAAPHLCPSSVLHILLVQKVEACAYSLSSLIRYGADGCGLAE